MEIPCPQRKDLHLILFKSNQGPIRLGVWSSKWLKKEEEGPLIDVAVIIVSIKVDGTGCWAHKLGAINEGGRKTGLRD